MRARIQERARINQQFLSLSTQPVRAPAMISQGMIETAADQIMHDHSDGSTYSCSSTEILYCTREKLNHAHARIFYM